MPNIKKIGYEWPDWMWMTLAFIGIVGGDM